MDFKLIAIIIVCVAVSPLAIFLFLYPFYRYARFARRMPRILEPKEEPKWLATDKKTFKVLSLNVKMIDWFTAAPTTFLSVHLPHKRRDKIIDFLKKTDYDVVIFQEAFNIGFQKVIQNELREKFPYQITYLPRSAVFRWINNGMMTISRYPMTNPRFLEFTELRGADGWVPKGATLATVEALKPFQILNTHMQSKEREGNDKLRVEGATEINNFLDENANADIPVILGGDFNVSKDTYYLRAILRMLRAQLYRLEGFFKFTWDPENNPLCKPENGPEPETLDWLFVRDLEKKITDTSARVVPVSLSDHYPVEREFTIE